MSGKDEVLFISAVLRQGDVVTPLSNGVTTNWFHSHKEEWDWIEQYIKKQRKCPSKVLFKDRFPDFQLLKSDDIHYTTRQLRESHVRYSLINSVDETLLRLKDNDDPIAVLEKTYQQLAGIQLEAHGGQNESELLSDWEASFTEVARR